MFNRSLLEKAFGVRTAFTLTVGLGFAGGILIVLQARAFSRVISLVFLDHKTLQDVIPILLVAAGMIGLRALATWGGDVSANGVASQVKNQLREELYQHVLELGPVSLIGERTGELTHTIMEGVEALDAYFREYLPQVFIAALAPLMILLFVFPVDWISGVILFLTAPLIPFFMILIGNLSEGLTRQRWLTLSMMSAHFLDALQGLTTLKMLGRSRDQIKVIEQIGERYRHVTMEVLRVAFLSALSLELLSTLSTALVAVGIGIRLLYGQLIFEDALFVLFLAPDFYLPLRMLGARFHAGVAGLSAAERIFSILDETKSVESATLPYQNTNTGAENRPSEFKLNVSRSTIRFEKVGFSYHQERQAALDGVSFEILPGEKVALIGPSGAGKSTITNLLLRFIEPTSGQIVVEDVVDGKRHCYNLRDVSASDWRAYVSWVPQRPFLFNTTVAENICLSKPTASMSEVVTAAQQAQAHDFIQALPQGYETVIGERGARLSGGQIQRLALARAFLKNAPWLILDEAAANLDVELETSLQQVISRLMKERSVLMIAHRLRSIYQADKILVLSQGRFIQTGTHAELFREAGVYRDMVMTYVGNRPLTALEDDRQEVASVLASPTAFGGGEVSNIPKGIYQEKWPLSPSLLRNNSLRQLFSMMRPYGGWIVLSVLLGFATIASEVGLMAFSAYIISVAALQPSIALLQVPIVAVRFFGLARGVFRYLERLISHQVTLKVLSHLQVWFYENLEPLAPARLMQYRSGDLLSCIMADIATLENFYTRVVTPPVVAILISLVILLFMLSYHYILAVTLLAFFFLSGVILPWFNRRVCHKPAERMVIRRAALFAIVVDSIQGLPDLLAAGQEKAQFAQMKKANLAFIEAQAWLVRANALQSTLGLLSSGLGMWSILLFAIPLVSSGQLAGVYLAVMCMAALASFEAVLLLSPATQYLENSLMAAKRLFETVSVVPEVIDPAKPLPVPEKFHLEVSRLSFRYPSEDEEKHCFALEDISFELPQGSRMAIVGPSGAGKTTLLNLILRFWNIQYGKILLGGKEISRYAQDDVRKQIAVISQNTFLFNASIRENLLMARPSASQEELLRAALAAQLDDFVQSLTAGYHTMVGEDGLRLSAGERQRVAIARALLKNAPLLLLDEATANLDTITEQSVLEAIETVMAGRTTLMISHRLVGMEKMDEILVLCAGRIVERGKHQQLMQLEGFYRRMWDLQSQILDS